jgi:8-hydroxy-5-deazaflavin:NADPH oxidoreductase
MQYCREQKVKEAIAIVGGTGAEGIALALRFARAGALVRIGSRTPERARAAARLIAETAGAGNVEGFENADAVREAGVVVLTVPADAQIDTLEALRGTTFRPGATLVDATVRLKSEMNSALIAAEHVPTDVRVASAFHTLSAELLKNLDEPIDSDVLICSDDPEAKAVVTGLVTMLSGARPIDAGGLKNSRLIENTVRLLIALNRSHKVKHSGIRITGI